LSERSKKILVVEDDEFLREAVAECLSGLGVTVVEARDGLEALQVLALAPAPGAILLDMRLPRLDGEGFLQAVRRDPVLADIPIVTMSGWEQPEASPPVTSRVSKPFDMDELAQFLLSLCGE
jgi:two-component system chemotaxis response regulator CheY